MICNYNYLYQIKRKLRETLYNKNRSHSDENHCDLKIWWAYYGLCYQKRCGCQARTQTHTGVQRSGSGVERRSKMSALWRLKKVGASALTLAPTWSRWRESNPRVQLGKLTFCHWTTPAYSLKASLLYHIKARFARGNLEKSSPGEKQAHPQLRAYLLAKDANCRR